MPNTLAHLGINGILSKSFLKKEDLLIIYFGALIPDVPWIFQRILPSMFSSINLYDLRLYCVVLATLFSSIILSAALANIFTNSKRTFLILSAGALIHLILDSLETKWANGVHFFAPFNWKLFNAGLFWPESIFVYLLTIFGLLFVIWNWKQAIQFSFQLSFSLRRIFVSFFTFLIYLLVPFLFMSSSEKADNHFVGTLRANDSRIGKYFEVDRGKFINIKEGSEFITSFDEKLKITNLNLPKSEVMSVKAKFIGQDQIQILKYHIHNDRDTFSYLGLILVAVITILSILNYYKHKNKIINKV